MATYSFSVDEKTHPRVIRWLESFGRGERSKEICKALDAWIGGQSVTHDDIYQAVLALERKIGQGSVILSNGNHKESEEPEDIANALDNLGL